MADRHDSNPKAQAIIDCLGMNWYRLSRYGNPGEADAAIENVAHEILRALSPKGINEGSEENP